MVMHKVDLLFKSLGKKSHGVDINSMLFIIYLLRQGTIHFSTVAKVLEVPLQNLPSKKKGVAIVAAHA